MRSGGKILVDQLALNGIDTVFTVPGESFLPALDALRDAPDIRTVTCRHEGGAAMMAEATARLCGYPAVALVTRAPGAANALSGVVCAKASAAPLLLIVGLPRCTYAGRPGAFQDIDVEAVFAPVAKWATVCRDVSRIPEFVQRACHTALAGRPGPVVLGIPEDVLAADSDVADVAPGAPGAPAPDAAGLVRLADLLAEAQRPLVIVGGPGWTPAPRRGLEAFAAAFDLPVAAAFRRQDAFDNRHPSYVGHCGVAVAPKLAAALRAADLVILAGAEPDEITTGRWQLVSVPSPAQRIVTIAPDPGAGLVRSELTLSATAETLAAALATLVPPWGTVASSNSGGRAPPAPWAAWRRDLKVAQRASLDTHPAAAVLPDVFAALSDRLPEDAVICGGAGNYAAFLHRYFVFKIARTSLSPPSGSMGYGLPAAIAASLAEPSRTVVAVAGDGCFLMTAQELATAAQYGASLIVIVVNNGLYGTIRLHQERRYPGRAFATSLANPDLTALAASFGAHAARVTDATSFRAALDAALARNGLRFIEVVADADEIAPDTRLSQLYSAD